MIKRKKDSGVYLRRSSNSVIIIQKEKVWGLILSDLYVILVKLLGLWADCAYNPKFITTVDEITGVLSYKRVE